VSWAQTAWALVAAEKRKNRLAQILGGPGRHAGHVLPTGSKRRRAVRDGRAAGLRQVHGAKATRCSGHTYSDGREAAIELDSGWS
jgi:hypothetical protein